MKGENRPPARLANPYEAKNAVSSSIRCSRGNAISKGWSMAGDRFLDDFRVGEKSMSGGVTITESEIIHFALQFDPQSFHLDVTAAEKSPYGGLIASGFHTLSLGVVNHLLHRRGQ